MEKTFSGTVTIGQPSYTLPSDFQSAVNFRITTPDGNAKFIPYMPFEEFDQKYPDPTSATSSTPNLWYLFGTTFNLYPAPEQAYTIDLRYLKMPTALALDADVPNVPEEFQELLVLGAWQKALERENRFGQASVAAFQLQQGLDAMTSRLQTRQLGQPMIIKNPKRYTQSGGIL